MTIINEIFVRAWDIISAPWYTRETLWVILPLVLILILIHIYFGRYKSEQLGWNSAFSNTISLLWITIIVFRFILSDHTLNEVFNNIFLLERFLIASVLSIFVLLLLIFNFFHILPKRFAFVLSSADFVYILAYIVISLVVGFIKIDAITFIASILVIFILIFLLETIKRITPTYEYAKQTLKRRKEEREKERKKFIRKIKKVLPIDTDTKKKSKKKKKRTY